MTRLAAEMQRLLEQAGYTPATISRGGGLAETLRSGPAANRRAARAADDWDGALGERR